MSDLELTLACGPYDRTEALATGAVKPNGIDLTYVAIQNPRTLFDRLLDDGEFDVSEMGTSVLISMLASGECPFVGLPVFPSKAFRHGFIYVNRDAGIREPKDLEGKTVGVPLYRQTAAIWIRGHLQHDYGVDLASLKWVQGAVEKTGRHGTPGLPELLTPVDISWAPPDRSLNDMLLDGEIDALLGSRAPEAVRTSPHVGRLFPDYREVERAYYLRTGIHPIMHNIVIRREVYERHPWIADSLWQAFEEAKARALEAMRFSGAQRYMLPWLYADLDEIDEVFGGDPWPYGIAANRRSYEALARYMVEQGIVAETVAMEEAFLPFGA